jgi:hypothetical protein
LGFILFDATDQLSRDLLLQACMGAVRSIADGRAVVSPSGFGHLRDAGSWEIEGADGIDAWLDPDGAAVHLDADLEVVARFATAVRKRLTPDVTLTLCDDSYEFVLDVTPNLSSLAIHRRLTGEV